jgi:hypothetical protein
MQVARRCCGFCDGVLWIDKCGWIRGAVQKWGGRGRGEGGDGGDGEVVAGLQQLSASMR